MNSSLTKSLAGLQTLTTPELRRKYAEVFGEPTNANNRVWLLKRVSWRLQALAEGGLSERARQRAEELARDADLRLTPPRSRTELPAVATSTGVLNHRTDSRLPPPGSILTRIYKGSSLSVRVLAKGFEYDGQTYRTLSAVAKVITGSHCNGYLFFGLARKGGES